VQQGYHRRVFGYYCYPLPSPLPPPHRFTGNLHLPSVRLFLFRVFAPVFLFTLFFSFLREFSERLPMRGGCAEERTQLSIHAEHRCCYPPAKRVASGRSRTDPQMHYLSREGCRGQGCPRHLSYSTVIQPARRLG